MLNLPEQNKDDDQHAQPGIEEILDALGDAGGAENLGDLPSGDGGAQGADDKEQPGEGGDDGKDAGDDQADADGGKPDGQPAGDDKGKQEDEATALRRQVEELSAKVLQLQSGTGQQSQPQGDKSNEGATQTGIELDAQDFLLDEDLDLLFSDKAKVNALLNKVVKLSVEASTNIAQERVLRSVPEVVRAASQQQITINNAVEKFYKDRPHLSAFRSAVAAAATGVHAEHPDWALDKVLEEAGTRTERMLALSAEGKRTPAFPSTPGGSPNRAPKGYKLSTLEKEILDLIEED